MTNSNSNPNRKPSAATIKKIKEMKSEAKIAALREAGVNVDNLFSFSLANGDDHLLRQVDGQLREVADDDPVFAAIMGGGTVNNPNLFRRWVMAQVFHMLATGSFTKALQAKGYRYEWKMLVEELRVQRRMWENADRENFMQRNRFFNKDVAAEIAQSYIKAFTQHVFKLPRRKCKGEDYVRIGKRNVFWKEIKSEIIREMEVQACQIKNAENPADLFFRVKYFFICISQLWLDNEMSMDAKFKDAYKGAGAYFTMRNLILFHDALFCDSMGYMSVEASLAYLEEKSVLYRNEGWRLFGLMKELIADNGISVVAKINAWTFNKAHQK